jgi:hypothetical protein
MVDGFDHAVLNKQHGTFSMSGIIHESMITCPRCGFAQRETMPLDACQFFYDCAGCGARLRPNEGDCCVFCSFGSVPCPPRQAGSSICA